MAGVRGFVTSGPSVTGSGSIVKTLLLLTAAANRRVHVHNIRVSYKGVTTSHVPHEIRAVRCTDGGTPEDAALTVAKLNAGDSESFGLTAYGKAASGAWSDEPVVTSGTIMWNDFVWPAAGFAEFTSSGIGPLVIRGGEIFAIQVVNPTDSNTLIATAAIEE